MGEKSDGNQGGDQIMKIIKARLREIIKEELEKNLPYDEQGGRDSVEVPPNLHSSVESLWAHLNGLLKKWQPSTASPTAIDYKLDLFTLMNDFLTSPDRPSPGAPEPDIEEGKKKGMFGQPDFKSKVAWVKRSKPEVNDPDAYVAGALRKAGELKEGKKHSVE